MIKLMHKRKPKKVDILVSVQEGKIEEAGPVHSVSSGGNHATCWAESRKDCFHRMHQQ